MFNFIISYSLRNKFVVLSGTVAIIIGGIIAMKDIPLDAVPDITNNQVQIVSVAPTLAPQEVEQQITFPIEALLTNIPNVLEVRSISRYGLSVITVVFKESVPTMQARQYVQEQLTIAKNNLPAGLAETELMPITTGLGEIYQYVLSVDPGYKELYSTSALRTIHDWIVKRNLIGIPGIIDVSSFGGIVKQYEVSIKPEALRSLGFTIQDVIKSLETNNENSGGSYIESGPNSFYIRSEGRLKDFNDIAEVLVGFKGMTPVTIGDIADVKEGHAKRYGAMTMDGQGEVVGGITLMLKDANSYQTIKNVKKRVEEVRLMLPEGIKIYPYLDRSNLINRTIRTVTFNLLEGGLIVVLILFIFLGNIRAGFIVATIIPLSMLFTLIMMRIFGISANLMSLGAIDFGIVVDGAIIITEYLLKILVTGFAGVTLAKSAMDRLVFESTSKIYRAAAFGFLIILVVFIPVLMLEGIEGKTFRPMAQTVGFAIIGALILSLTLVPVLGSLLLRKGISEKKNFSDRFMDWLSKMYRPGLIFALKNPVGMISGGLIIFLISIWFLTKMGAVFVPTLEEGDIAIQQAIKPGSSLDESIRTSTILEKTLLAHFPEVEHVVSKIGTAEVPTDPMAIEDADIMVIMRDKSEWTTATTREEIMDSMAKTLAFISWAEFEFTQPIQLRFNELMTGSKADISMKIFGENVSTLKMKADEAEEIIQHIDGVADVKVDQTEGLQQLNIEYDRKKMALYGVSIMDANQVVRTAFAGEKAGDIFEGERRFDLVVRNLIEDRSQLDLDKLIVRNLEGQPIPLSQFASINIQEGPMMISREQAKRFINIGINVRGRDIESTIMDIQHQIDNKLKLAPGYMIQYGGQYENLQKAKDRLSIAVPVALILIVILLYITFKSVKDAMAIFISVPLSAIGGVLALWVRDMPFSISAGIGFVVLFGISVLDGLVLISAIRNPDNKEHLTLKALIEHACLSRLRPVILTALTTGFGFLPMALSTGSGAEVQKPLATVVIGGLLSSTILTLLILPAFYYVLNKNKDKMKKALVSMSFLLIGNVVMAQYNTTWQDRELTSIAIQNNLTIKNLTLAKQSELIGKKAVSVWAPTQFQYNGGQINFPDYDHYFGISQNFSHLLNKQSKLDVIEQRVKVIEFEQKVFEREILRGFNRLYDNWMYNQALLKEHNLLDEIYAQLELRTEAMYSAGEVSLTELDLIKGERSILVREVTMTMDDILEAQNTLYNYILLDEDRVIEFFGYEKLPFNFSAELDIEFFKVLWDSRQQLIRKEAYSERKEIAKPDINLGYFNQGIEKQWFNQGVLISLGIPIDRSRVSVIAERQAVQLNQINNEWNANKIQLSNNFESLNKKAQSLYSSIIVFENMLQNHTDIITRINEQQNQGVIDYYKQVTVLRQLYEQRISLLHLIKEYNNCIIDLTYLVKMA